MQFLHLHFYHRTFKPISITNTFSFFFLFIYYKSTTFFSLPSYSSSLSISISLSIDLCIASLYLSTYRASYYLTVCGITHPTFTNTFELSDSPGLNLHSMHTSSSSHIYNLFTLIHSFHSISLLLLLPYSFFLYSLNYLFTFSSACRILYDPRKPTDTITTSLSSIKTITMRAEITANSPTISFHINDQTSTSYTYPLPSQLSTESAFFLLFSAPGDGIQFISYEKL